MKISSLILTILLVSVTKASKTCSVGLPAVLGPELRDGNTEATVFMETPNSDIYLVGGWSDSLTLTEHEECAENGCAFVATWSLSLQEYSRKWIFPTMSTVLDISFSPDEETFAIVFSMSEGNEYKQAVMFNDWLSMAYNIHIIDVTYDKENFNDFAKLSFFQANNYFFLVNNEAN